MTDAVPSIQYKLRNWGTTPSLCNYAAEHIDAQSARIAELEAGVGKLRRLHDYVNALRVEGHDVLHYTSADRYDHRTSAATNLLAVLRSLTTEPQP